MAPLTLPPICLCLHPSSPFFKRDPSFLHSFHPSFFQPCGWTRAFLYKDGCFWTWGRLGHTVAKQAVGTVRIHWGLDSSWGMKGSSEEGWHGKWIRGGCDTVKAEQAALLWQNNWGHLTYLTFIFSVLLFLPYVLKMPFIGLLLLGKYAPCTFLLSKYFSGSTFPGHNAQEKDLFLWASSCILWAFL